MVPEVGDDSNADPVPQRLLECVVARKHDEFGRLVGTGDHDFLFARATPRFVRRRLNGVEPGEDAVAEAPSCVRQLRPGPLSVE